MSRDCRRACGARGRRWAPRSLQWQAQYPEPPEGTAARVVAAGPPAVLCVTAIGICKAMQCPETAEGPAARVVAAGPPAVLRVTAIGICKAMQCPETAEGPAARVVAAGPLALCSGRRSTQSLQKGLRRAWSPLGPLRFCALVPLGFAKQCSVQRLQKGLRGAWSPLGPSLSAVAGAVPRASRRDCGARGRRWAPAVLCVTAIVICKAMAVTGCEAHCNGCGTRSHHSLTHSLTHSITDSGSLRSVQRLQKGLRRSVQRLQKGLRRAWSPLGPPLSPQYPEPPEGAAARVVAAGPLAVLCVTAIVICKAMVVTGCESHWNGCGKDARTLCLCTTAIVISTVLVLAGSESHCKCCDDKNHLTSLTHSISHIAL